MKYKNNLVCLVSSWNNADSLKHITNIMPCAIWLQTELTSTLQAKFPNAQICSMLQGHFLGSHIPRCDTVQHGRNFFQNGGKFLGEDDRSTFCWNLNKFIQAESGNIPEDSNLQSHCCNNLKSESYIFSNLQNVKKSRWLSTAMPSYWQLYTSQPCITWNSSGDQLFSWDAVCLYLRQALSKSRPLLFW